MVSKVLVALDVTGVPVAVELASRLAEHVAGFKIGLELLTGSGPAAVERVAALGKPVFADVKLHDIPTTVERASANLAAAGARWVSVHASGGGEMIEAAVAGMGGADETGVLAVTVLTSIGEEQLAGIGLRAGIGDQVRLLAILAAAAGAEGVVCAPGEAPVVKEASRDLMVVTPGIRLADGDRHDQRRVMTPGAAASAGADYLVIGRAITASDDPVAVARRISKSLIDVG